MNSQPIKEYMQRRGMRPAHLAKKANMPTSMITRWMHGEVEPSLDTIIRVSAAMGIKPWTLLKRILEGS